MVKLQETSPWFPRFAETVGFIETGGSNEEGQQVITGVSGIYVIDRSLAK